MKGETVKVVKELNDDKSVKSTDRLDAFKFNITLAEGDGEYFVSSQRKIKEGDVYKTAYVYALNGMLGLTTNQEKQWYSLSAQKSRQPTNLSTQKNPLS